MGGSIDIIVPQERWPTFEQLNIAMRLRNFPVRLVGFSDPHILVEYVPSGLQSHKNENVDLTSAQVLYLGDVFEGSFHFCRVSQDDLESFDSVFGNAKVDREPPKIGDYWMTTSDPDVWKQDNAGLYVASALVAEFGGYCLGDTAKNHEDVAAQILKRLYLEEIGSDDSEPTPDMPLRTQSGLFNRILEWLK